MVHHWPHDTRRARVVRRLHVTVTGAVRGWRDRLRSRNADRLMSHPLNPPLTRRALVRVVDEADVDTIEMELRPEDLARLAQLSGGETIAAPAHMPPAHAQVSTSQVSGAHSSPGQTACSQPANAAGGRVQAIQAELAAGLEAKATQSSP